jgi:hypothetical protein
LKTDAEEELELSYFPEEKLDETRFAPTNQFPFLFWENAWLHRMNAVSIKIICFIII